MSSSTTPQPPNKKAACIQFHVGSNQTTNIQTAKLAIDTACKDNIGLVVLPEVWNSPYATCAFPEYGEVLPEVGEGGGGSSSESVRMLAEQARKYKIWIVGGSIPEAVLPTTVDVDERTDGKSSLDGKSPKKIYNTCLCFNPEGVIVAKHRKVHLFDINVPGGITFRESDTLTAGSTLLSSFDTGKDFGVVGVGICYDIRFPELALLLSKERGVSLICYPGAFNMVTGPAHWELLQRARAVDSQCYVLTASPARATEEMIADTVKEGMFPPYTAWGHSSIVNPWGEVIATCDEKVATVVAEIDLDKVRHMRSSIPTCEQKRGDLYEVLEKVQLKREGGAV